MRFIGDVHAKFNQYRKIVAECENSIQVGDFGIGFASVPDVNINHRFIRGNHDNPGLSAQQHNWISDGHFEREMFFLGGGFSVDRVHRTEGVDWWPDEQLSTGELYQMVDRYSNLKPRVLVCHECPSNVVINLFDKPLMKWKSPSKTSHALGSMLAEHAPEIVIFGHWHQRRDKTIDNTRFICLEELGWIDLDV